jgi:class 3 adenylate cyclase
LALLAEGLTNREIAEKLFISSETVKWYNKQLYSKLGVHSRSQAVAKARAIGLLDDDGTALLSRTVTFLFTDIEGSTKLWERHPEAMRAALQLHDALLRRTIQEKDGRVFKTMGDALFRQSSDGI